MEAHYNMARFFLILLHFFLKPFFFTALLLVFASARSAANESQYATIDTARFTLHFAGEEEYGGRGVSIPVTDIAESSLSILNETYEEYTRIFALRPEKKLVLRFLTPRAFRRVTGAPDWTSAMYFRDEITIPLTSKTGVRISELKRALRHEYVHAIVAEASHYRCPAWIDEGVAQMLEGRPNPLLGPALRRWIERNPAMPLEWLENGFTTLDTPLVPAAYAQSLFAARKLIRELGFSAVTDYLEHLRRGSSEDAAFRLAFKRTKPKFEAELTEQIKRWAASGQEHP